MERMDDFLIDFNRTLDEAERRLAGVTAAQAARPVEGGWSAQQILGHLIDSAANNHQRFVRAQFTDDLDFPGYAQEQWVLAQHYDTEPWPRLLGLWLAFVGSARLAATGLPDAGMPGQFVAATLAIWNPYVAERLLQGHWSLLVGYVVGNDLKLTFMRLLISAMLVLLPAGMFSKTAQVGV